MGLSSHISYQITLHHNEHQFACYISLLQQGEALTWILVQCVHLSCWSKIYTGEFSIILRNWKIVKLEYQSPSIENDENIEFNNFELKTGAYIRVIWNIFFSYETKRLIKMNVTIVRSVDDIMKIMKHPPRCWNVMFNLC